MGTVTKGYKNIGEGDLHRWDGTTAGKTYTRTSSIDGKTITLDSVGHEVEVLQSYGNGVAYTRASIASALTAIGATNKVAISLRPGDWVIDAALTITSNITLRCPPGVNIKGKSIRNDSYRWVLSSGGTNEYYLQTVAGANPSLTEPNNLNINSSLATAGTAGSLSTGQWDWADNDTLGYSTVYVRLSDETDPDTKAANYIMANFALTIQGPVEIGRYQVFDSTYTEGMTFSLAEKVWPEWWGLSMIPALANEATPSVLKGELFLTGGTTTITDFDDGYTGKTITIIAEHSVTITDGTNIFLNGSGNYSMGATDTLTLVQKADGLWYEVSRSNN